MAQNWFTACQDPAFLQNCFQLTWCSQIQYWGFLVVMMQDPVFTILTLYQISVALCLLFKPLYTAVWCSRPFFPIWCHPQSCRGGVRLSQQVGFFPNSFPNALLNSWPFLWSNSHCTLCSDLSCSFLKTIVSPSRGCHCIESPSGAWLYFLTWAASATSAFPMCFVWFCLHLQDDVNLPYGLCLYHVYPGEMSKINYEISADSNI